MRIVRLAFLVCEAAERDSVMGHYAQGNVDQFVVGVLACGARGWTGWWARFSWSVWWGMPVLTASTSFKEMNWWGCGRRGGDVNSHFFLGFLGRKVRVYVGSWGGRGGWVYICLEWLGV